MASLQQIPLLLQGGLRYVRRRYIVFGTLIVFSIVLASLLVCKHSSTFKSEANKWQSQDPNDPRLNRFLGHPNGQAKPGFFHVLVTASTPDVNLCKTIISAVLAGYPTPSLVNWARRFDSNDEKKENPHIARITGVNEYLQNLDSSHDEDLVLVVDGYDIWFQLGPQILIDRYHELCREADELIKARLGSQAVKDLNIRQNIIFSAQKECWPGGDEDMNCYAVPNSTLPEDVYGPGTDTLLDDPKNPSAKVRQRYLSSGIAMGSLAEMRHFYDKAMAMYKKNPNLASDQSIFARLFGEQEYQREVIRFRYSPWTQRWRSLTGGYSSQQSILDPHPTRRKMEPADGASLDVGLGLDYWSTIGQATVFSVSDSDWIVFNDTKSITDANEANGITKPGVGQLNEDVAESLPPFWTTTRLSSQLPGQEPWSRVRLYSNLYTGITPAIIHHNAYRDNLKTMREVVWDKMWFQPHIREMLKARLHEPYLPVAETGPEGARKAWWGPTEKRSLGLGAQPADQTKEWISWSDLVDDNWSEEVFRDGKGSWSEV